MFEFTDFANILFILAGYYCIIKGYNKLLLFTFLLGTFNHDSTGFLVIMFILFNVKTVFKKEIIFYSILMMLIFVLVKLMMEKIFAPNPGLSFRLNYMFNISEFTNNPLHIVLRNVFLMFGGLHLFVIYFFVSGRWKRFNTKYLYITLTIVPYVIILFLIHTLFEARNYITAIPFVIILFLMFFSTQQNSFLKPLDAIKTDSQK